MEYEVKERTQATEAHYLVVAKRLIRRYEKETSIDILSNYSLFNVWLCSKKATWKKPTWRQNKAAVCYLYESEGNQDLRDLLLAVGNDGCKSKSSTKKTSSMKQKYLKEKELNQLTCYLIERKDDDYWAPRVLAFLHAGILTGLRLGEWCNAVRVSHMPDGTVGPALKVKNMKSTNGRSHGEFRYINMANFTDSGFLMVTNHLNYACPNNYEVVEPILLDGSVGTWAQYQKSCADYFYRMTRKILRQKKMYPTLYTCRHQFSTNLKAANYTPAEVASLMGHSTDETATIHYGSKSKASGYSPTTDVEDLPIPYPPDVAKVKEVFMSKLNAASFKSVNKGLS